MCWRKILRDLKSANVIWKSIAPEARQALLDVASSRRIYASISKPLLCTLCIVKPGHPRTPILRLKSKKSRKPLTSGRKRHNCLPIVCGVKERRINLKLRVLTASTARQASSFLFRHFLDLQIPLRCNHGLTRPNTLVDYLLHEALPCHYALWYNNCSYARTCRVSQNSTIEVRRREIFAELHCL